MHQIRLTPTLHDRLQRVAAERAISVTSLILSILEEAVQVREEQRQAPPPTPTTPS